MTIPNRVTLDDLRSMSIDEINALSGEQLALAEHEACERLRAAKTLYDWIDGAIALKYGDQAQEARRAEGKDTGTVRLQDGPVTVVAELPKRVDWNQAMLAGLVERIRADGADPAEYVEVVREYGVDLPAWVEEYIAERRVEKEALIEQAVGRAELREIGGYTVGITYGRCSQNEVAEAMREQGADASVIVKPAGSASIRGTDEFDRCHEVAGKVNGGGHPKAAGCKPDIYDDMLDYANHWTTRGAVTKRVILDAFRDVVAEADDDEDDDAETSDD